MTDQTLDNNVGSTDTAEILFEACTNGDLQSVQQLLQDPIYIAKATETEVRTYDEEFEPSRPLLNLSFMFNKAAEAGAAPLIDYLLLFAATHNISYDALIHRNSVCSAMESNNAIEVFKALVSVQPDIVNIDMGLAGTPLTYAIATHKLWPGYSDACLPFLRFLIENGADPNQVRGPHYKGPGFYIHAAGRRGTPEIIELLLQHGAQIEQSSAMHEAAERERLDVLELLLRYGADVNGQLWKNDPMFASRRRTKLKSKTGIKRKDESKWDHETPINFSVLSRKIEATAWLKEHGADPGIVDSQGWSPRAMAIKMDHKGLQEALGAPEAAKQ